MVVELIATAGIVFLAYALLKNKGQINIHFVVEHRSPEQVPYNGKLVTYDEDPSAEEEKFFKQAQSLMGAMNTMLYGEPDVPKKEDLERK